MGFKLQESKSVVSETAELGKLPIDPRTDATIVKSQVQQKGFEALQKTVSGIGDAFVELQGKEAERFEELKTKRLEQEQAIEKALEEAREKAHKNSRDIAYTQYSNALEEYGKAYAIASKTTNSDTLGILKEDAIPVIDQNEDSPTFGQTIDSIYDIPLDVYRKNIGDAKNAFNVTLYPEFKTKINEDARHAFSISSLSAIENSIEGQTALNIATVTATTTQLANGGKVLEALNIHEQNRYIYEASGKPTDMTKWVTQKNKILEIGQELDFTKLAEINPLRAIEIGNAVISGDYDAVIFQDFEIEYPTKDGKTATFSSKEVGSVLDTTIFDFYKSSIKEFMLNENSTSEQKTEVEKALAQITDINIVKKDYMSYSSDLKNALLDMVEIKIQGMPEETEEQRKEKYIALNVIAKEKQNIIDTPSMDLIGITKLRSIIGIAETQSRENADKLLDQTYRSEKYLNMSVNEKINYLNDLIDKNSDDAAFVDLASSTIKSLSDKEPNMTAEEWEEYTRYSVQMDEENLDKGAVFMAYTKSPLFHSTGGSLLASKIDDKIEFTEMVTSQLRTKKLDLQKLADDGELLTVDNILQRLQSGNLPNLFFKKGDNSINANEDFAKLSFDKQIQVVNRLNGFALLEFSERYKKRIKNLTNDKGLPRPATDDEAVTIASQTFNEIIAEFNNENTNMLRAKYILGNEVGNYFSPEDIPDIFKLIDNPELLEKMQQLLDDTKATILLNEE
jgi:hypothetical protein